MLGVKPPEREADLSTPSSSQIKEKQNYTYTLTYNFWAWSGTALHRSMSVSLVQGRQTICSSPKSTANGIWPI